MENARKMLEENINKEIVSKITGLTFDELKELDEKDEMYILYFIFWHKKRRINKVG